MPLLENYFSFYNVDVCIKSNSSAVMDKMNDFFGYFQTGALEGSKTFHLRDNGNRTFYSDGTRIELNNFNELIMCGEREIFDYVTRSLDHVTLHAGAISYQDLGILLVGHGRFGKTSLTLALMKNGLKYLSDDIAPIDDKFLLHPFPKLMSVRPYTFDRFPEIQEKIDQSDYFTEGLAERTWFVDPLDIFPGSLGRKCKIRHIFLLNPDFKGRPRLEDVSKGECAVDLMKTSLKVKHRFDRSFHTISDLVKNAKCHRLYIGDLDDTASMVVEQVENEFRESP